MKRQRAETGICKGGSCSLEKCGRHRRVKGEAGEQAAAGRDEHIGRDLIGRLLGCVGHRQVEPGQCNCRSSAHRRIFPALLQSRMQAQTNVPQDCTRHNRRMHACMLFKASEKTPCRRTFEQMRNVACLHYRFITRYDKC